MLKIGVLVSGGGTNLQAIINAIENKSLKAEIVSIVSGNPKAYALERGKKHNIPTSVIKKSDYADFCDYENDLIKHFKEKNAELIVLAGFMTILGENFIKEYENKIMNIHPSLIPSFCGKGFYGLKVHEAALARGVKITGATVHFVDTGADTGPIILQKAVEVKEDDTPETLQRRVMEEAEWVIFPEAIRLYQEKRIKI